MALNQYGKKRLGHLKASKTKIPREMPGVPSGGKGEMEAKGGINTGMAPTTSGEKVSSGGKGEVAGNSGPRGMAMKDGAKEASRSHTAGQGMGEVKGNKSPDGGMVTPTHDKNRTTKGM